MAIFPPPPPLPMPKGFIQAAGTLSVDGHEYPLAMLLTFESVEQLRRALNSSQVRLRVDLGVSAPAKAD